MQRAGRALRVAPALLLSAFVLAGCGRPLNDPYPGDTGASATSTIYASFSERPKHLDPARAYTSDSYVFVGQVYRPLLQYHYLRRPFELIPDAATEVPKARYFDREGRELSADAAIASVAFSTYDIRIRPGMGYQPHPALALDAAGAPRYHALTVAEAARVGTLFDFAETGSREVTAEDYVHQIKRLAHPGLQSPIAGKMGNYIVGLTELSETLRARVKAAPPDTFIDLASFELEGAQVLDRHTFRVKLKGKYPQFVYWLAMPFFAPMPPEADRFYAQPALAKKNISLDWYPLGSGPYMFAENDPNRRMVLARNPHFSGETYPVDGAAGDREAGLLTDAGRALPLTERLVYTLEKEQIPYWNKFLQGWFDSSGISSDSFDQAVQMNASGDIGISDEMAARGISLQTSVATTIFYLGFNWSDPVVGSSEKNDASARERARKLRHAVSIAIDQEEFISIFRNGRALPAQGPIAPGIIGFREGEAGLNRYMYDWVDGAPKRKSIDAAKRLLAEAGYPNGRDAKTGQPLVLHLDTTGGGPGARSRLEWYVRQLQKIDIQLVPRVTDWNRFQDKLRQGNVQMFFLGWNADYPDPENFLFLLYGPEAKVGRDGNNSSNYRNAEYDRLFEQMKGMDDGPPRQQVIDRMVELLRRDAPWVWGFHPVDFTLRHAWLVNSKPNSMAHNARKYHRVDGTARATAQARWNEPKLWPLGLAGVVLIGLVAPAWVGYRRRERRRGRVQ
ncbi:MAG: ABC transporter substrate-binding protein [Proteobacteria bacterium]|nr:ABC transporter substrate-binding protein [Burkholderiales bacterium]